MRLNHKKNILFFVIVFIELIILTFAFYTYSSRDTVVLEYSPDQLSLAMEIDGQLEVHDGAGILDGTSVGNNKRIITPSTPLSKGVYQVDVYYQSNIPAGSSIGSHISAVSDENAVWLNSESVMLNNKTDHAAYRFYVNKNNLSVKLKATMDEDCYETVSINRVTISLMKSRSLIVTILKLLLLFLIMDAICYILFFKRDWLTRLDRKTLFIGCTLVFLLFLLELPMTMDYLPKGYDLRFHYYRIYSIATGLQQGIFPVKVQPEWVNGYGYATGIFYGDIFLYFPAVIYALGFPLTTAYKIYVLLANLFTLLSSYYCFKTISKDKLIGLSGCVLYSFSLHKLVATYTRAALGAFTAMSFLPFIILGLWKIYYEKEPKKNDWIFLVIGITGILESHVLGTIMTMMFVVFFALVSYKKTFSKTVIIQLAKAGVVTVLLNLFFILPFLDEYANMQLLIQDEYRPIYQYSAYISQLFTNTYNAVGDVREDLTGMLHDMPMTVGPVSLLILLGAVAALILLKEKQERRIITQLFLFILLALWMSTNLFPYKWLDAYASAVYYIFMKFEFAWRFQAIAALLIAVLSVALMCIAQKYIDRKKILTIGGIICALFLWQGMEYIFQYNDAMIPFEHESDFRDLSQGAVYNGQYLPDGFNEAETDPYISVSNDQNMEMILLEKGTLEFKVSVNNLSGEEAYVEFPLIPYKGYLASTQTGNLLITQGSNSRMRVIVPVDFNGEIHVHFQEPWYWRMAEILSLMTLLILIITFCKKHEKYQKVTSPS